MKREKLVDVVPVLPREWVFADAPPLEARQANAPNLVLHLGDKGGTLSVIMPPSKGGKFSLVKRSVSVFGYDSQTAITEALEKASLALGHVRPRVR
jgi:hypothetical protein